ncbi:MAG: efflux RND transporter periplasmic adaptor subunit [Planctomycetota bacterium]
MNSFLSAITSPAALANNENRETIERQLARARHAQLLAAIDGRLHDSAEHAERASTLRRALDRLGASGNGTRIGRMVQAAIIGGGLLLGASFGAAEAQTAGTPVRIAAAIQETVAEHQRVTGSLQAISRSSVAAEEAGAIAEVMVDEGHAVTAGQRIAAIDDARHRAHLAETQAELLARQAITMERQAELAQAQSDLEQLEALAERDATTQRELRDGQTAVRVAEARLESARLQADAAERLSELAQIQLDDLSILAPFDGRVVARHVEPGEWVDPGDAIVTLVSSGNIEARLEVPERFAAALSEAGDDARIRLETPTGSVTTAAIRAVPEVDARARTFPVLVAFANDGERLSPGMSVTAWVPSGAARPHITVPRDAVIRSARGAHVFVVETGDGEEQAVRNDVRILFETEGRVALAAGDLSAGDRVVIEGNERLRTETTVTILNPDVADDDARLALGE